MLLVTLLVRQIKLDNIVTTFLVSFIRRDLQFELIILISFNACKEISCRKVGEQVENFNCCIITAYTNPFAELIRFRLQVTDGSDI